jgi:hypothetical protein
MFELAACLGLVDSSQEQWFRVKHLFWTNNPIGNALFKQLRQLEEVGVLEFDEEETKFRWSFARPNLRPMVVR